MNSNTAKNNKTLDARVNELEWTLKEKRGKQKETEKDCKKKKKTISELNEQFCQVQTDLHLSQTIREHGS